jgi:uncharacterized alpha-E superfamily protein
VIDCLLLDPTLPRSARFSAQVALDSVSRIDGPGRRSKPKRLLSRLHAMFVETAAQLVAEHPREFETECRGMLRQLDLAMRETYFHPSRVAASVMGDVGRAMPQQQQQ